MKTLPTAACVLKHFIVFCGTALPVSAQVSNRYNVPPPPGYPASPAAIQAPAYNPAAYPPPPGYGTSTASRLPAKPAAAKTSTKPSSSSKKSSAGPPPPLSSKVYGPSGDISSQVARLQDSDKVQNIRLGELERDVSSIKRGSKSSGTTYNGGTDLAAHTTYVARPGDTLWRIATTHRVSVGEIQQLNRMTGEEVLVGQTLLVPSPHRLSSPTTTASYKPSTPGGSGPVTSGTSSYTVKKGDSLKAIAIRHRMTTAELASANRIKNPDKIYVGQRLKIPGSTASVAASPSTSETVPLPGFGVENLPPPPSPASLAPPPAPAPAPAPPPAPSSSALDSHRGILAYRVDRSDTIESIATQFSTTPERIREINRLDASTPLKPNDEIMVPAMGAVSVSR